MMDVDLLNKVENAVKSVAERYERPLHNEELFSWYESVCISILDSGNHYGDEGELEQQLSMILAAKSKELGVGYDV